MASAAPAARVEDPFGHSSAMNGVLIGLAVGALIGTAILTGGVSLIAVGAAVAITGGAGMAGQAIGRTIPGPDTGVITIGSPSVFIDGRPAAMTVIATGPCRQDSGPLVPVATGAATVRIHAQPAARVGETMACSAVIRRGSDSVFIGGPSETVIQPTPEVPVWLENTMLAMTIGGTAIGTLGVGLTYGAGAAIGSLAGGMAGGHYGGQAASAGAAALGYGATGQAIAGVAGGMLGGALGGGIGFRGGALAESKIGLARGRASKATGADLDGMLKRAPAAKAEIDGVADEVAGQVGGRVAKAPLKSRARALEKIEKDYDGDASRIKDLARNTIIVPKEKIPQTTQLLRDRGVSIKEIEPTRESLGYSGVNGTMTTKSGLTGEIQVNSPEMIYAKESPTNARSILGDDIYDGIATRTDVPGGRGHTMYEEYRSANKQDPRRPEIVRESMEYYDHVRGR